MIYGFTYSVHSKEKRAIFARKLEPEYWPQKGLTGPVFALIPPQIRAEMTPGERTNLTTMRAISSISGEIQLLKE